MNMMWSIKALLILMTTSFERNGPYEDV